MDLSVVVLNWNTCGELRDCLRSIFGQPHRCALEIVVADNASSDDSRKMVKHEFPLAKLVAHPRNLGFSGGNNIAARDTTGRYLLFLNSDTVVTEGAFDALIAFADTRPKAAIVGPKLINEDGSLQYSCRHFPNLGTGFFRNTPLGRLFPKNRFSQDYLMTDWDHASPRVVDWVSGAALLIRSQVYAEIGGWDEGYFFYCEDVDICKRASNLGHEVVYYPESVIMHIIGRASDKVPTRMTYEFHRSMYRFYRLHYAATTPILVRPLILPGLALRSIGQLARYRWRNIQRRLRPSK